MGKIPVYLLLLLFFTDASGQNRSDTLLHLMKKAAVPGLSLAYIKDGKLQEHYSLGVKSNDTTGNVNDSTVFSAASLSKPVFSYAVFNLVKQKKLDLDKPLHTYYNYKDLAGDPRSKLVTARMVLSHSSGLPNWRDGDSLSFLFTPGARFSYSGEGMVWLSRVVENITKKDIQAYIRETIFEPLHMFHTSYKWEKNFGDNYAYPHIDIGQTMSKYFPTEANVAQSLQTTAIDYSRFLIKMLNDKAFIKAIKKEPSIRVADQLNWGLGLGHQTTGEELALWQWGDNGTFKALLISYPEKKEAIVYFANSFHGLKIAKDILKLYFGRQQPCLTWLGTDSASAPDLQLFESLLHTSVTNAITPFYEPGKNRPDTNQVSLNKLIYLGNRFIQTHDYEKSIALFMEGLKVDAANDNLYAGLAEAYLRYGNRSAALNAIRQAVRYNPGKLNYNTLESKLSGKPVVAGTGQQIISFQLPEYMNAHYVSVVGTFNGWNDYSEPMQWKNGKWTIAIPLSKGEYRYKFVVDGVWLTDIRNPEFDPGSFDSILTVQ